MAKCKILMQTAQVQKLVTFFDGYKDDKVELKYVSKAHCKSLFKKTPEGSYMYFSIQPDGFFG